VSRVPKSVVNVTILRVDIEAAKVRDGAPEVKPLAASRAQGKDATYSCGSWESAATSARKGTVMNPIGLAMLLLLPAFDARPSSSSGTDSDLRACIELRCAEEILNVKAPPYSARGDGIADDTAAIQSALDAAHTVLIPPGTYLLSLDVSGVCLHLTRSDTTLVLEPGAVLRLKDSQISSGREGQILVIGDGSNAVSDVAIVGSGTIDGNRASNSGTVENSAGVQINPAASDVVIRDVTLRNVMGDAILMRGLPSSRIQRVLVEGIHVVDSDEGILFKYSDQVQILGSRLSNIDLQDAIEPHGFSEHWVVANNSIDGVPNGQGVDPFDGTRYGLIANNSIRGAQQAMDLSSGGPWDPVTDLLVEGNVISASIRESIYVPGNDARTDTRFVIRDNVIDGGMYGVYVGSGLKDIRIEGNHITNTVSQKGIFVDSGAEVDVLGNVIAGCALHGIDHRGNASLVRGNVVKDSSRAAPGGFPAIQLNGGSGMTCTDNMTFDDQAVATQYSGIWVRSSSSLVERNSGYGNIAGLITDERGPGTVIRENNGFPTEGQGATTWSGDASRKDFGFAHGLTCAPDLVQVSAKSADAAAEHYWTADATSVVLHFLRAPRAGADNVSIAWRATCPR
jgi:hypothetical protein